MAMERKTVKRGIWRRETITTTSWSDLKDLSKEAGWDETLESRFRENIANAIAAATKVLNKAGHPTRNGIYTKDSVGSYVWLADFGTGLKYEVGKSYHAWPYFLPAEDLSLEDFAKDLIHNARGYLQMVQGDTDKWQLAMMSLHYAHALLRFTVESTGIAAAALAGSKAAKGAKKGRQRRRELAVLTKEIIVTALANLNVSDMDAMAIAKNILQEVNRQVALLDGGRALAVETVQKYVQELRRPT